MAITWEPDFSQASRFCRMSMNHKNFHFTQIPDKINDVIFLKNSKNPVFGSFLSIFGHFCPMGIFSKKSGSVTHSYIWENLWTDRRTDRRTNLFNRTLSAEAKSPIKLQYIKRQEHYKSVLWYKRKNYFVISYFLLILKKHF